jgi:hypothetical protein
VETGWTYGAAALSGACQPEAQFQFKGKKLATGQTSSPKVVVPKDASDTRSPLSPSNLYFIFGSFLKSQELLPLVALYR